jgi:glycosyltransferase involved in cell wall biosynthesis
MVHSNIFALFCKFFKVIDVPIVITAHSVYEGRISFFYRLFSRVAAHCIHISSSGLSLYINKGYFFSKNSSYIPNGTAIYTESKEALNLGNPVRFVTVGRLAPEKNYEFMINAMEQLKLCGVSFTLSIVGDGVLRSDLERLIVSKGLNESIRIEGIVSDVRARLESSDFFLMSSHFEGMPMSLLEACEVGLPSLVTDVGSCKEVIDGLPNCFAVTPNDLEQYVSSLKHLMLVNALSYFLGGQEIRKRVVDSYSVNSSFRELQKVYLNVACKSIS